MSQKVLINKYLFIIFGSIATFVSILSLGINSYAFSFWTSQTPGVKAGAWWASVIVLIGSILFAAVPSSENNRGILIASCVFLTIGWILALIGCGIDGIETAIVADVVACVETYGSEPFLSYPSASDIATATLYELAACAGFDPFYYSTEQTTFTVFNEIICVNNNLDFCMYYEGGSHDPSTVIKQYLPALRAAISFDAILV